MEASKLCCCNGSPLCPYPCRVISTRRYVALASKASCSASPSHSSGRRRSAQLGLAALGRAVWDVAQPVWAAAEEIVSSTSAEAATTQIPDRIGALSVTAGSASSQAAQSPAESITDAASVGSQAAQFSVESVQGAVSQTAEPNVVDANMVINVLGTAAFVALVALTVAVFYLFIIDFLAKRKSEEELKRLNEEEAAARKKNKGSLTPVSKGGGKGFGRRQADE